MMTRARLTTAALVALVIALAGGAFAGGWFATDAARGESAAPAPSAVPPLPRGYVGAGASPASPPAPSSGAPPQAGTVRTSLAPLAAALGPHLRAEVVDIATGAVLYDRSGTAPAAPASTAKLLTAAAILTVHKATDRFSTRVVAGAAGSVVLVGGGDPTLTGAAAGKPGAYPGAARITGLAAQLRRAGVHPRAIVVDGGLFSGPQISPAWAPEDVPSSYASPITALLSDGGRAHPGDPVRSTQPDLDAGHELAAALGRPGLRVSRGHAAPGARVLAAVRSAPVGTLVEQMLQASDNVIAECLARQVALAKGMPASFLGAAQAIRSVLDGLGVHVGAGMVDGSGLAASDRLTAAGLATVVRLVAGTARPALHAVVAALPVAAWSGTLTDRYLTGAARRAAGVVRAKTGSLTGVTTLAGVVHDRDGRLLGFALLSDRTGADAALDAVIARLAACGCG